MAWNAWMSLNKSLSPLKLCANVCICSYAPFSVDATIFSSHSQIPQHFQPLCQTKAPKCHHPGMGCDVWILPIPWSRVGSEHKGSLLCSLFPLLVSALDISALLLPDSLSPRNNGVDNSASHHGDDCLIWDECYITHHAGTSLIHQHLLLLSPCSQTLVPWMLRGLVVF